MGRSTTALLLLLVLCAGDALAQTPGPQPLVEAASPGAAPRDFSSCNDPTRGSNNTLGCFNGGSGNRGSHNTGLNNIGSFNQGNDNVGNYNVGNKNQGSYNTGDGNVGFCNTGSNNVGNGLVGSGLVGKKPCPAGTRGGVSGVLFA